jgi:hypothetical protein
MVKRAGHSPDFCKAKIRATFANSLISLAAEKLYRNVAKIELLEFLVAKPVFVFLAAYFWFIYSSPLSMIEMDLNKNGWGSFAESYYTANYGRSLELGRRIATKGLREI